MVSVQYKCMNNKGEVCQFGFCVTLTDVMHVACMHQLHAYAFQLEQLVASVYMTCGSDASSADTKLPVVIWQSLSK